MNFKIKETRLTDGSIVWDVDLFANGGTHAPGAMCIFSCPSETDARKFFRKLAQAVDEHTCEELEEVVK